MLDGAVAEALDALPLASASGLGTWAAGALREAISAAGLEPAKLDALKPVLVNSAHVAQADDGVVSARLLFLKEQAVANPLASNDVFSSIVSSFEQTAVEGIESFEGHARDCGRRAVRRRSRRDDRGVASCRCEACGKRFCTTHRGWSEISIRADDGGEGVGLTSAGRSGENGQMTVELAVALPVLLAVAAIAVNALLFFSECAAFDVASRDAVRIHAASPAYGQDLEAEQGARSRCVVPSLLTARTQRRAWQSKARRVAMPRSHRPSSSFRRCSAWA